MNSGPPVLAAKPHLMPELVIRELDAALEMLTCSGADSFTYAVRDGSGLTKIGSTKGDAARGLQRRIRQLQLGNGSRLHLLGIAHDEAFERVLHARYAAVRKHGEWFAIEGNPLPIVGMRCVCCGPLSRDESGMLELARMRIREAKERLAAAAKLMRSV